MWGIADRKHYRRTRAATPGPWLCRPRMSMLRAAHQPWKKYINKCLPMIRWCASCPEDSCACWQQSALAQILRSSGVPATTAPHWPGDAWHERCLQGLQWDLLRAVAMIQGSEAEELEGGRAEGSARRGKRARLVWTAELHARFMNAVNHLVNLGTCGFHQIQHAGQSQ